MRLRPLTGAARQASWLRSPFVRRVGIASVIAVIWLAPLVSVSAGIRPHGAEPAVSAGADEYSTMSADSAFPWQDDTRVTATNFPLAQQRGQQLPAIGAAFTAYYNSHNGADALGNPLTPAYPTAYGIVQFFTASALLLPTHLQIGAQSQQAQSAKVSDELLREGVADTTSGIVRLPLVDALLTVGSEARIGGADGTLTYVDLRQATLPREMRPAPAGSASTTTPGATITGDEFVPVGKQGTTTVGHLIPLPIWQYITRSDVSPDGWQTDFGAPLTEALPLTATRDGAMHHLVAQIFRRGGVIEDQDPPGDAGGPTLERLDTGVAYLETLGPPRATPQAGTQLWATGDTTIASSPASDSAVAHVGQNFPLLLTGDTAWLNGELWYGVTWRGPGGQAGQAGQAGQSGNGWVPATATTFASPNGAPAWASFDALSPELANYLNGLGRNVGVVVYDETRGQYYTYNQNGQFIMASSAKVPIMLTFLTMTEHQGREPNDDEMYLLTTMIENSDNDSAQALFDEVGGAGALASFARSVHVSGINPNPDAWGWSTVSPLAMVQFLTLLHDGKVLNAHDRALALHLMENIESDQRNGVGNTAPKGAAVAMKDGWVPAPDGLWAMNSSGIVTVGRETYIIAVYTQDDNELSDGWNITQHVAGTVGQLLTQ